MSSAILPSLSDAPRPGASIVVRVESPETYTLPGGTGIDSYQKSGADLSVVLDNGQQVHLQNFFVAGADGDFSRVASADGNVLVSGLIAPEPDPDDMGSAAGGGGMPDDDPTIDPLALTGVGLGAGLGAEDLLADGDSAPSPQAPGAVGEDSPAAEPDAPDQSIDDLLADLVPDFDLPDPLDGLDALTGSTPPAAFADAPPPPADDSVPVADGGFADTTDAGFDAVMAPDLLTPHLIETDI